MKPKVEIIPVTYPIKSTHPGYTKIFEDEPMTIAPEIAAFPINLIFNLPLHKHIT